MKTIRERLEEDRVARSISAAKQAELIGLSAGHLSRLCNGKVAMGSRVAAKIASHLGIAAEEAMTSSTSQKVRVKADVFMTSDEFMFLAKAAEAMAMPLPMTLAVGMVIARRERQKTK